MTCSISRRGFVGLLAGGAVAALAGCSTQNAAQGSAASGSAAATADGIKGAKLTFVGDDAFAPYRYIDTDADGKHKVVGLDIAIADEMASRLGFTYTFEPQDFAATLASIQGNDTAFTMAMSANEEREETYDFTRGYYQPLVGVLTMGGDPIKSVQDLAGKSIACTTGTVQNKFITKVMPDADVHTYDGGDQCLQEVLAGRIDAYLCDGAEGQSMRDANEGLVLGLLDRAETADHVEEQRRGIRHPPPCADGQQAQHGHQADQAEEHAQHDGSGAWSGRADYQLAVRFADAHLLGGVARLG